MKASLTVVQRVNLHALVGSLPVRDTRAVRMAWAIQDKIELTDEERKAVGFEIVQLDGDRSQPRWDAEIAGRMGAVDVQFSSAEASFLRNAFEIAAQNGGLRPGPQRAWLQPLLDQFVPEGE